MKIKSNFHLIIGIVSVLIIGGILLLRNAQKNESNVQNSESQRPIQNSEHQNLELKFAQLSNARTNFCAGPDILERVDTERLQGSCCSAMDFHRYTEQVEGLKKYSDIEKVPSDPYDIPVSLADELLDFQKTIKLTVDQQAVYDEAVNLSDEGGPCCCKCWRWYTFEGLAKYLITEYDFNGEQIAQIWDLEDGCGGPGHIHHQT